jgi:hypothetical protein
MLGDARRASKSSAASTRNGEEGAGPGGSDEAQDGLSVRERVADRSAAGNGCTAGSSDDPVEQGTGVAERYA